ncbi:hypothetical protein EDD21DRAFT_374129 [Dissophora ornata]|nr:hypothetical protein BGZ58_009357 [Dissophora ornata]KAI8601578.1 hypothetical protein EDD21DRAFT_374129 [Dissophora ornata]
MAQGMDRDLMALMGIEEDIQTDQGLEPFLESSPHLPDEPSHDITGLARTSNASPSDSPEYIYSSPPQTSETNTRANDTTPPRTSASHGAPLSSYARPTPRANTSSLFASNHRASSPPLFSPEFNPFGVPPGKIRVIKSAKKKNASGRDASSMFSPTLSPRKVKKPKKSSTSNPFSATSPEANSTSNVNASRRSPFTLSGDVSTTSPSLLPTSPPSSLTSASSSSASAATARGRGIAAGLSSPVSSFMLKKKSNVFLDSDSDISSIEETSFSKNSSRPIALRASLPSSLDTGVLSPIKSSAKNANDSFPEGFSDLEKSDGEDFDKEMREWMQTRPSKSSQKELDHIHSETAKLIRTASFPKIQRVVKRDLTSLLKLHQAKLNGKRAAEALANTKFPFALSPSTSKPKAVALNDDSDDELEPEAYESHEYRQWKLSVLRAMLVTPISKEMQREIERELKQPSKLTSEKRLEIEKTLQIRPLSNKIQNMSLHGDQGHPIPSTATFPQMPTDAATQRSVTSPSKIQRSSATWTRFREESRRKVVKLNLDRHKSKVEEAKKSGIWRSPEEFAEEQMKSEEKRGRGLDPDEDEEDETGVEGDAEDGDEEDEDYDPDMDNGPDRHSVDRGAVLSGESEGEEERGMVSEVASEDDEDDESRENDEKDTEDEEMEDRAMTVKRSIKKRILIDDVDEIKISVVDHSRALTLSPSDSENSHQGLSEDDEDVDSGIPGVGDENGDENGDVSDLDEAMDNANNSQGFAAFFKSSIDPSKPQQKQDKSDAKDQGSLTASSLSSSVESDPRDVLAGESKLSGALLHLSGELPALEMPDSSEPTTVSTTTDSESIGGSNPGVENERTDLSENAPQQQITGLESDPKPKNVFDILTTAMRKNSLDGSKPATLGLRRLHRREAKPDRERPSKNKRTEFIEYEAEEEDDENKGMGGVDYESENEQDEYDLGDGMVDTAITLNSEDMERVRNLHMKQEQDRHDKEISDLVHGIAAGNLWKRRNGQMEDLDIFDEGDMEGRFQRKKRLKMSEKFEKLADDPSTAAFAKAFGKGVEDEQIVFLSDPDESNDEADASGQDKTGTRSLLNEDGDEDMAVDWSDREGNNGIASPLDRYEDDIEEDEEQDEPLNTDKRKERLRQAKLRQNGGQERANTSIVSGAVEAMTKGQVLPFGASLDETFFVVDRTLSEKATSDSFSSGTTSVREVVMEEDPIDEYKETMRRSKAIRNIMDGVEDGPVDTSSQLLASQRTTMPAPLNIIERIVDAPSLADSSAVFEAMEDTVPPGVDVDRRALTRPHMLSRQNSSFLSDERRGHFLSTVGDEGRQSGGQVVKDVNRRRMAFAAPKSAQSPMSASETMSSTTSVSTIGASAGAASSISNVKTQKTITTKSSRAATARTAEVTPEEPSPSQLQGILLH